MKWNTTATHLFTTHLEREKLNPLGYWIPVWLSGFIIRVGVSLGFYGHKFPIFGLDSRVFHSQLWETTGGWFRWIRWFFFFPAFSSGSFCIDIYDFVVGYNVSSWPRTRMFLLFLLFLLLVELDECVSWRKRGFSTSVRVLATTCAFDRSFLLAVHFPIRCWPDFKSPTSSVTNDLERNDVASSIVIIAQWQSCFNFGK